MAERMMVIAAHMGDFVWRCGGSIAKYIQEGAAVKLIVLSDGIRGESNGYWKKEGANAAEGKAQRLREGKEAAARLGVTDFEFWNFEDYPMTIGKTEIEKLAHALRLFRPDFIVTHDNYDAYNPDHNAVNEYVRKAYACSTGAGYIDGLAPTTRQVGLFGFEPHFTEASHFEPCVYVDITDAFEAKCSAMKVYASQKSMYSRYVQKAEIRADEVCHREQRTGCKYAEAFSLLCPILTAGRFVY